MKLWVSDDEFGEDFQVEVSVSEVADALRNEGWSVFPPDVNCAACGMPGHRYGRNEGLGRYDPMACINTLRGEVERLHLRAESSKGVE